MLDAGSSQYGPIKGGGGIVGGSSVTISNSTPLSPLTQTTLEKHLPGLPTRRLLQKTNIIQKCDIGCITDICSSEQIPEVEIFSLLEEQIPKYKIRADTLTQFGGYENEDWFVPCPALKIPPEGLALSKDEIRETLNYFLLCGNRVSQMTRAYDDIEAVTRLLEEKEKDLELTVQIGKELLAQNTRLENRVSELEGEIKSTNENLAQLSYELHAKSALLSALTNDEEGSETGSPTTNVTTNFTLDLLQKKISTLEHDNRSLRAEATQLVTETDKVEEEEQRLMAEIRSQLNSSNYQYDGLCLELERYKEENKLQYEQIINLQAKLNDAQLRLHQLTSENEDQTSRLSITEENQNLLATELMEFKSRYEEILSLLQEAQEQLRQQRKRGQPSIRGNLLIPGYGGNNSHNIGATGSHPIDSLRSELMETSLFSDNSLDSGIASDRCGASAASGGGGGGGGLHSSGPYNSNIPNYRKVFETVRCASKNGQYSIDGMSQISGNSTLSQSYQPRMATNIYSNNHNNSLRSANDGGSSIYSTSTYPSYGDSSTLGPKSYSRESLVSDSDDSYPSKAPIGVPGAPGAKDLEAALKRLTPAQVLARRSMLSNAPPGTYTYDEIQPHGLHFTGIRTPDSIMSTGSLSGFSGLSGLSGSTSLSAAAGNHWRLPDKLQIVKPMEGSQTLHHWNRLATPTLSGLLDERPGVTIRGGRGLEELGLQTYSLSDVEEDADDSLPGKQFQTYGSVFTFTNSTVMHPDDGMSITSSIPQSHMSSRINSMSSSRQPSVPSTPRHSLSRRNSCSTFSVNSGLASMLNERGIKAITPSALNTPAGPNFSPTVTPCNSPDGTPERCRSPEPSQPALFSGFFSSGAELFKRKMGTGGDITNKNSTERQLRMSAANKILLSRQEKRALRSLRILEKFENIGLENIIQTPQIQTSNTLSGGGSGVGIRSHTASPMAQLTSLKNINVHNKNKSNSSCSTAAPSSVSGDDDDCEPSFYKNNSSSSSSMSSLTSSSAAAASSLHTRSNNNNDDKDLNSDISNNSNNNNNSNNSNSNNSIQQQLQQSQAINTNLSTQQTATSTNDTKTRPKTVNNSNIHRQRSRRGLIINGNTMNNNANNNIGGQRPDLGTVGGIRSMHIHNINSSNKNGRIRSSADTLKNTVTGGENTVKSSSGRMTVGTANPTERNDDNRPVQQQQQQLSMTQSFVGTISSLFFGRKGGLL